MVKNTKKMIKRQKADEITNIRSNLILQGMKWKLPADFDPSDYLVSPRKMPSMRPPKLNFSRSKTFKLEKQLHYDSLYNKT